MLRTNVLALIAVLVTLSAPAFAQEATAGGALSAQASWTALQNMLTATNGNVSLLRTDVDAMKVCGAQKKIWTGTGCMNPTVTPPSDPRVERIINCSKDLQFYNGTTCVDAPDMSLRWAYGGQVNLGKTEAYMAPASGIQKYKSAGISEACTTAQNDARPCTKKGAKCYAISSYEEECGGSRSEHTCLRIKSHHFQQCM